MKTTSRTSSSSSNVSTSPQDDSSSASSGSKPYSEQKVDSDEATEAVTITRKSNETVVCVSPVLHLVEPDQPMASSAHCEIPPLKRQHGHNSSSDPSMTEGASDAASATSGTNRSTSRQAKRPKHASPALSVSFCEPLVTEVLYRPKTLPEDKTLLHYTFDEMDSFREEYYIFCQEQMVLDELAASSGDELDEEPSELYEKSISDSHLIDDDLEDPTAFPALADTPAVSKHAISKVMVVLKSDTASDDSTEETDNTNGNSSDGSSADEENPTVYTASNDDDYFFDNSAFWNGNLTWC